jgi:hypothetical protein
MTSNKAADVSRILGQAATGAALPRTPANWGDAAKGAPGSSGWWRLLRRRKCL